MSVPAGANAVLLFSVFCIAVCGLVYELLAGTVSSYLLGDSVYQFSIVIGVFVSSMGLGSYLSRFVGEERLADRFVLVQLVIGVLGGYSAAALFAAFAVVDNYAPVLFLVTGVLGALIGLEIPLVIRILKGLSPLSVTVSNVFTLDYIGALFASLLFPIVLVPRLGLLRTAFFFGLVNVAVAFLGMATLRVMLKEGRTLLTAGVFAAAALGLGFHQSQRATTWLEDRLYEDDVIFSAQSEYQRVVVSRSGRDVRLYLNGSIQFDTRDEYRYHESLVHPAMLLAPRRERVLILGGGDGMAAREVLKYGDVRTVTLVDIDKTVTDLFASNALLTPLNGGSLTDPRVTVVNEDAWKYLERPGERFDVVLIDLPDPDNFALSKLYTKSFYSLLMRRVAASGVVVTQASSPLYSREAFWCVYNTLAEAVSPAGPEERLHLKAYHAYVPSFGEWGFVMASPSPLRWESITLTRPFRFLSPEVLADMTAFPDDMARLETDINRLDTHKLIAYYEKGWSSWHA